MIQLALLVVDLCVASYFLTLSLLMTTPPRLLWFLLVDSDGNPYKGTRPSSVPMPLYDVVAQF